MATKGSNEEATIEWDDDDGVSDVASFCSASSCSPPPVEGVVTTTRGNKLVSGSMFRSKNPHHQRQAGVRASEYNRMSYVWPVIVLFVSIIAAGLACSKYWDVLTDLFGDKVSFVLGSVVSGIVLILYCGLKSELREKFEFLDRKNSDQIEIALWRLNLKAASMRTMDTGIDTRLGDTLRRVGCFEQTFEMRTTEVIQKQLDLSRSFTSRLETVQQSFEMKTRDLERSREAEAAESEKRIVELNHLVNSLQKRILELERRAEKRISASERHFQEQLGEVGKLMIAMDRKYDAKLDSTMRKNFEHELHAVVDDLTGFWRCDSGPNTTFNTKPQMK